MTRRRVIKLVRSLGDAMLEALDLPGEVRITVVGKENRMFAAEIQRGNDIVEAEAATPAEAVFVAIDALVLWKDAP